MSFKSGFESVPKLVKMRSLVELVMLRSLTCGGNLKSSVKREILCPFYPSTRDLTRDLISYRLSTRDLIIRPLGTSFVRPSGTSSSIH